ncbi:hypothetical protein M885DRAFT_528157 [Pelagophyceae sp. CCMP2097]|nr:hypothetical protein M885DRAFT_528157 [Pelagophyceae sp. CCMP2097]
MVPALFDAFAVVLQALGEHDALAALYADHERWDDVAEACRRAAEAPGPQPLLRRTLALRARRSCWDWSAAGDAAEAAELVEADAVSSFAALSFRSLPAAACAARGARAVARADAAAAAADGSAAALQHHLGGARRAKLPWVAVLTPDANAAHPLAQLLPGALGRVSAHRVLLVTLCAPDGSAERAAFEAGADAVVDAAGASAADISAFLARGPFDVSVLVDMCGHAGSADVLEVVCGFRRLARQDGRNPLVVGGGLGTPAQMGDGGVYDYTLCDAIVAPLPFEAASEKRLWMPHTYFVGDLNAYARACPHGARDARAAHGLREGAVVLTCMNRAHKLDRDLFDRWLDVLLELCHPTGQEAPVDAQLWLLARSRGGRDRALAAAAARLPGGAAEAVERLAFADGASRGAHLKRLACADVALDTVAYGSHTLAVDCAWAGVPLVTAVSEGDDGKWAARVGAAATLAAVKTRADRAVVREACVAEDWGDAYVRKAILLARDFDGRARIHKALAAGARARLAPLWDAARWADGFDRCLAAALMASSGNDDVLDVAPRLENGEAIVLASSSARVAHFDSRIAGVVGEVRRVDAIEGGDAAAVAETLQRLGLTVANDVWNATAAQVACAASHASRWRACADARDACVILEDDAVFPAGADAFRRCTADVLDDLEKHADCDLCYLYVYPDHWPTPPRALEDGTVGTRAGFRTWCLVAYVVTRRGAETLQRLLQEQPELYTPIDCIVADWGARGLLNIRAADAVGFVDNRGQLDLRAPEPDRLKSNVWNSPPWAAPP